MTARKRRATANSAANPVVFRGPPHRLRSLVRPVERDLEPEALRAMEVRLDALEVRRTKARLMTGDERGVSRVAFRLPASTRPGRYEGAAQIGEQILPIVVEVEPRPRMRADPPRVVVDAAPGGEVTLAVTFLNTGNVPCDVPGRSSFCLFDGRGIDHAFWVALTTDPPEGRQRIDLLMDDLADSHGGLVQTVLRKGGGEVVPGEAREVEVTLRFSDRLRPGHTYAGAWELTGLRLPIRVAVPPGAGS